MLSSLASMFVSAWPERNQRLPEAEAFVTTFCVARRGKRKEGTFLRSLFDANNMGWGIWLAGNICGDDHGFLLLVVLGEADFRAAPGQFASGEITCNPNLAEKIVAAHGVEDELGVC
jgi:hypothetical protein